MAHYAEIDSDNIVLRVIVIDNKDEMASDGTPDESIGATFCQNLLGGNWLKTSYNGNIRKHYAGIGYKYNQELDAFTAPQPYPSWTLDTITANWTPPIPMPIDEKRYIWNETTQSWDVINEN